jgi:hypothetical protein
MYLKSLLIILARYIFPVVFAAYVIAMHLSWSGYGEDR